MNPVLIDADTLRARLNDPALRIADARFDLADPAKGEAAYAAGHLPGAIYAHLDRDLSDHARIGLGRHPLPTDAGFSRWLSSVGYAPSQTWVIHDDQNGSFAARLWWMLRAVGHRDVRVLDGGFAGWRDAGGPITLAVPQIAAAAVSVQIDPAAQADFAAVETMRRDATRRLIDARAAPRFRGDVEPIDPVAGHVPGALNRPFADNLDADGRFKSPERLRAEWRALIGDAAPNEVIHMCGSGVTACHNLLAMEHAGLHGSILFPPSWSGWIADRSRAVATGDSRD